MSTHSIRVYADPSIFAGVLDWQFAPATRLFFDQVRAGRFQLVTSAVVEADLETAPGEVHELYEEVLPLAEVVPVAEDAIKLRNDYLDTGVVETKWSAKALHVAVASVAECTMLVTWDFRHVAHFDKIPLYRAVSSLDGFPPVAIYSPLEVIAYDDHDE
jgi:hypothetical protein